MNVVRIYHVPPRWFLDCCAAAGVRVLITLPWAKHVEFLDRAKIRREIVKTVRAAVAKHAGHPAIFGYLVGNEIPTTMVRWLGVRRVTEFLETLINVGREADPNVRFSLRELSADGISPPAERRFLLLQRLPARAARFRESISCGCKTSPRKSRSCSANSGWTRSATARRSRPKCSTGMSTASCAAARRDDLLRLDR